MLLRLRDDRIAVVTAIDHVSLPRGESAEVIGYPSTDGFTLRLSRAILRPSNGDAFV